jgi:cytochrome c-type biogenesis protein CcmH/NrfG
MSDELKDILGNSNKDIDNQKLMDYLSKQLSKQDSHEVEKLMADDDFMNDAVEGLQQFGDARKMTTSVEDLNRELQKQIAKKKKRKEKRRLKEQPWVYFTIILLLLLAIVSYVLVKKYMDSKAPQLPKTSQLKRLDINPQLFFSSYLF